ncbi:hypothetical protein LCGC14_2044770 [marine sediment metagenome]|uniref:Uncharacterized protein n=1 Tax=marine sediment metagenome TaxID=412755 RepID=A0A0F9FDC5_9ZZZZ
MKAGSANLQQDENCQQWKKDKGADQIAKIIIDELLDPASNLKYGFNNALLKELLERTEGKVTLPIGGDKENPIYTITVSSEEGKKDVGRLLNGERT